MSDSNITMVLDDLAAERQRGDTYRARALALLGQVDHWRRVGRVHTAGDEAVAVAVNMLTDCQKQLTAAHEHASISLARSASDGLAKEAAESALEATKRAIVRDLWPHLDFQYPQITFAIQRAGETIAAAQVEAAKLAGLVTRCLLYVPDKLAAEIDAALAARDPQTAPDTK